MPELAICAYCDAVHRRTELAPRTTARCTNCGAALYKGEADVGAMVAIAITAAAGLAVALTAPLLTLQSGNTRVEATLWGAIAAAWRGDVPLVGLVLLISLVIAPICELGLLLWIVVPLSAHVRPPGFAFAMRTLRVLRPWRLVEVFLLGVLVSIVKLAGLATASPGWGVYGIGVLVLSLASLATFDRSSLWRRAAEATA
ncbi:MAG TPA: paraquat-inducible protein A [Kofleriaceae bacterium]|jgi:paraquat-inducible protein A